MKEFIGASAVLWCIACYWLGGQEIPFINQGFKWIRRFMLPIGLGTCLVILGSPVTLVLLAMSLLVLGLSLGYQNRIWKYFLTGLVMGLPALMLGRFSSFNLLIVLTPCLVHTGLGWLSLKLNRFQWSWVALVMGWAIGVAYVGQIY